ncbi:hypothetical protein KEJ15_09130, partial [Candidatus Bathyarchaeota archaeon]|nr:hypothetical protein [Candidatus Bathyarchaeota archaeon]
AADFNQRLREKGCSAKVTAQKVCKIARDEDEVREILEAIWKDPEKAEEVLAEAVEKNKEVYDFEKMMEDTSPSEKGLKTPPLTA